MAERSTGIMSNPTHIKPINPFHYLKTINWSEGSKMPADTKGSYIDKSRLTKMQKIHIISMNWVFWGDKTASKFVNYISVVSLSIFLLCLSL